MQLQFIGCGDALGDLVLITHFHGDHFGGLPFLLLEKTLEAHLGAIDAKRLILTHMSDDMLGRLDKLPYSAAHDGMDVKL